MLIQSRHQFRRSPSWQKSRPPGGGPSSSSTMACCRKFRVTTALLLSAALCSGCGSPPDLETSHLFQSAEQIFSDAKSPSEFAEAATVYQEILDKGFHSGSVYYNQGNAWMQAGETGRAIAAYRQAKRRLPRDPYLDANLRTALAGSQSQAGRSMLDYVFFWQSTVSYTEKLILTTVLLALSLLLAITCQLNGRRVAVRRMTYVTVILWVLSTAAAGRDWQRYEQTVRGAVITETTARKGDSETYEPAFTQSLSDGTEFEVVSRRNDWIHARFGQTGTGWISSRDCVTY
jgi:hypothetical protein